MPKKKNDQPAPTPTVTAGMSKEQRTQARKAANVAKNEAARLRNIELKSQGMRTPHEEKRVKRALARRGKQKEYEARIAARKAAEQKASEARAEREDTQRESMVDTLVRDHKRSTRRSNKKD